MNFFLKGHTNVCVKGHKQFVSGFGHNWKTMGGLYIHCLCCHQWKTCTRHEADDKRSCLCAPQKTAQVTACSVSMCRWFLAFPVLQLSSLSKQKKHADELNAEHAKLIRTIYQINLSELLVVLFIVHSISKTSTLLR